MRHVIVWSVLLLAVAAASCSRLRQKPPPPLPVTNSVTSNHLIVYSDFQLPQDHRLLGELDNLRTRIGEVLAITMSGEPINVYLFKTPDRYYSFVRAHYPIFPDRRAIFVRTDTQLNVFGFWSDRVAEDLRHEVSHGYLHAVFPDLPLWLDEGLAESFEVPPAKSGLNREHLALLSGRLNEGQWQPDLARIAAIDAVDQMDSLDYAESWAWVHFLLKTEPNRRKLVQDFLTGRRQGKVDEQLELLVLRTEPDAQRLLEDHLRNLALLLDE